MNGRTSWRRLLSSLMALSLVLALVSGAAPGFAAAGYDGAAPADDTGQATIEALVLADGPAVTITSPADGSVTNENVARVIGLVSDDAGIASVTVNGRKATLGPDGNFAGMTVLVEGTNTITVVARNTDGEETTKTVTVIGDWTHPLLEQLEPSRDVTLAWGQPVSVRFVSEPGLTAAYQLVLDGTPGTRTTRNVPVAGKPMNETSPGVYEAVYTPEPGTLVDGSSFRINAADAAQNVTMVTLASRIKVVEKHLVTEPIYSYADAVRERVWVQSSLDSDGSGEPDLIAVDIIRPQETEDGLLVPSIVDASPYYASLGRGRESQKKDLNNPPRSFPLYYDNYFVPRGYAVVLPSVAGTDRSTGCPDVGGPYEIAGMKAVIDWLNGRVPAFDADGNEVEAHWSTGKAGMIGKSWDGSIANGVAATGVEGLETIVPVEAISNWYSYFWSNGVPLASSVPYLYGLNLARPAGVCNHVGTRLNAEWSRDGDYIPSFYDERNYLLSASNVKASVFVIEGLNDYNVKPEQYSLWWDELAKHDVPRKIWLSQTGHEDAFDYRRSEWETTLHRWFDYWLHGIDNGIMDEPMADVQHGPDDWRTYDVWPHAAAEGVALTFGQRDGGGPGTLNLTRPAGDATASYTENYQTGNVFAQNEWTVQNYRLAFLTAPLTEAVHVSGETLVELTAKLNRADATFTAMLVDYGVDTRVNHASGGGLINLSTRSCHGEGTPQDTGCFLETAFRTHRQPYEIVARGWLRARYHESLEHRAPVVPGEDTEFTWSIQATDYIFKPGHRIGIVIAGGDRSNTGNTGTAGVQVTVNLGESRVTLPVVGGAEALAFGPDIRPSQLMSLFLTEPLVEHDTPEVFQILDDSTRYPWTEAHGHRLEGFMPE